MKPIYTKFINFDFVLQKWTFRKLKDGKAGRLLFSDEKFSKVKEYADKIDLPYSHYSHTKDIYS